MNTLISLLSLANIMLAIALFVVTVARMDRSYAMKVRAEHERKSILRGETADPPQRDE